MLIRQRKKGMDLGGWGSWEKLGRETISEHIVGKENNISKFKKEKEIEILSASKYVFALSYSRNSKICYHWQNSPK